jgi:hypothetical protein
MNIFLETYGKNQLTPKCILTHPILFLAFGFGSGLVKGATEGCGCCQSIQPATGRTKAFRDKDRSKERFMSWQGNRAL